MNALTYGTTASVIAVLLLSCSAAQSHVMSTSSAAQRSHTRAHAFFLTAESPFVAYADLSTLRLVSNPLLWNRLVLNQKTWRVLFPHEPKQPLDMIDRITLTAHSSWHSPSFFASMHGSIDHHIPLSLLRGIPEQPWTHRGSLSFAQVRDQPLLLQNDAIHSRIWLLPLTEENIFTSTTSSNLEKELEGHLIWIRMNAKDFSLQGEAELIPNAWSLALDWENGSFLIHYHAVHETEAICQRMNDTIKGMFASIASNWMTQLAGLQGIAEHAVISAEGTNIDVNLTLSSNELDTVITAYLLFENTFDRQDQ